MALSKSSTTRPRLKPGQQVRVIESPWGDDDGEVWVGRIGTVRQYARHHLNSWRVDNGDPGDPRLKTNGFTWSAWIPRVCLELKP